MGARADLSRAPHQRAEQEAFATRQWRRLSGGRRQTGDGVVDDRTQRYRRRFIQVGTTQQRPTARDELGHREWLDEIVVGSVIKTHDAVVQSGARCNDQYRDPGLPGPKAAQKFQPVAIGQAEVQQDQVEVSTSL